MKKVRISLLLLLTCAVTLSGMGAVFGQGVTISIAIPDYVESAVADSVADFEANTGISVNVISTGSFNIRMGFGGGMEDVETYLDGMEEKVSEADIMIVGNSDILPEATRAGYYLDLSPLVLSDSTDFMINYYAGLQNAFAWDGGTWALPIAADANLIYYDPAAFNEAGLAYPDSWRTLDDMANAIRTLTEYDAAGEIIRSAYMNLGGDTGALLLSAAGVDVYDDSIMPSVPDFSSSALESVLETWAALQEEGLLSGGFGEGGLQMDDVPIIMGGQIASMVGGFGPNAGESEAKLAAPLPGGGSSLNVQALAVSSGTQHPIEAYQLMKYLITDAEVATAFVGNLPAQSTLAGAQPLGTEGQAARILTANLSDQVRATIEDALFNGMSPGDTRFASHLTAAVKKMLQDGLDTQTALNEVEAEVLARLAAADARAGVQVTVKDPNFTPEVAPGEVVLNVGITDFVLQANPDAWDALMTDFAASDPEVGYVNVEGEMEMLDVMAEKYDCFYLPQNQIPNVDLTVLRNLDPLLASDPDLSPDDFIGGVLAQVQREGQTWAFPLLIQPTAMYYNPDAFTIAGAFEPGASWTVGEFESALQMLDTAGAADDDPPFQPNTVNDADLLTLIAAYGGLPLDTRTDPPTINFTDPASVDAIRQVLDLAKDGLMAYEQLARSGGMGGMFRIRVVPIDSDIPLYTQGVGGLTFGGRGIRGRGFGSEENNAVATTFPQGTQYNGISYSIQAAYISADTQNAEACYRLLKTISEQTDLLDGMPSRRSVLNDPALSAAQGEDMAAFYREMDALMSAPNTITLSMDIDPASNYLHYWLDRAFDRYVLEDADLEAELEEAQTFTRAYSECAAAILPFEPAADSDFRAYYEQFSACASQADPTIISQ